MILIVFNLKHKSSYEARTTTNVLSESVAGHYVRKATRALEDEYMVDAMSNVADEALLEVIEKSGLISPATLTKAIGELESLAGSDARGDGLRLLEHLVASELLTPWQAGKLRQHRHKGFLLGNYKLLSRLGAGGMSSVYLAEHIHMRQLRALKVLPRERVADASYLARFYREARAAAALDHPNIVQAYDIDSDGETHFLVVEYIDGSDLQKLVTRKGPLSYASAVDVMRQVASGLAHAHKVGVVHRDIKPANLFVDAEGTVKILDMGLARFTAEEIEQQASLTQMHDERVLGTTNYLAPEQAIDSHTVDGRADIYSLGCTFYFLLTGSPPFPSGTVAQRLMKHINERPEPISTRRPGVPRELEAIFDKLTAKQPNSRYQSAAEVEQIFRDWEGSNEHDVPDSGLVIRTKPPEESSQRRSKSASMTFTEERVASPTKDTLGGRGDRTGIRDQPPPQDDDLQLADDDAPVRTRAGEVRNSNSRSSPATKKVENPAAAPIANARQEPPIKVADGAAARNNDFMAELMSAAESAAPAPMLPGPIASGKKPAPLVAAKPRPPASEADEGESVKKDLDRLFRRHPIFATIIFGMFAVMLVLGLYYMIRSSHDAPSSSSSSGTSRDQ
ncbi:MAG: serine/threonine protein kinase [Planctomycetia bacterium]|nr:serine/threonine protein kinase [Planctomycetia bacterium]